MINKKRDTTQLHCLIDDLQTSLHRLGMEVVSLEEVFSRINIQDYDSRYDASPLPNIQRLLTRMEVNRWLVVFLWEQIRTRGSRLS